jgi:DeoD family purine-nucleoside phosphorylase
MPARIHLHLTAPLAERVLLPGDPGRALLLAQALLSEPKMLNHNRGLWGYTGTASDGEPMSIQSTGMGGPSAAIVIAELASLGARRLVRVGTCGALREELQLGDLVIASEAIPEDGTSRALGADRRVAASPKLIDALRAAAGEHAVEGDVHFGPVVSTDLFYEHRSGKEQTWLAEGALAVEMETAALLALAAREGLDAAAVLLVSDRVLATRERIGSEELRRGERLLGEVAAQALAAGA